MEVLPITQDGCFTYNKRWQFNVQHSVPDLHITECGSFTYNTVGSFTYKAGLVFHV